MQAEPTHCLHYRCPGKGGQCLCLPVPGFIPKHPGSWGSCSEIPQLFPNARASLLDVSLCVMVAQRVLFEGISVRVW